MIAKLGLDDSLGRFGPREHQFLVHCVLVPLTDQDDLIQGTGRTNT